MLRNQSHPIVMHLNADIQEPIQNGASVAPTSEARKAAMLVLLMTTE